MAIHHSFEYEEICMRMNPDFLFQNIEIFFVSRCAAEPPLSYGIIDRTRAVELKIPPGSASGSACTDLLVCDT